MVRCEFVVQRLGFYGSQFSTNFGYELTKEEVGFKIGQILCKHPVWVNMLDKFKGSLVNTDYMGSWEMFDTFVEELGKCVGVLSDAFNELPSEEAHVIEDANFLIGEYLFTLIGFKELVEELDPMGDCNGEYLKEFTQAM